MNKIIIVVLALAAVAVALPVSSDEQVKILRSEYDQQPEGAYVFSFEAENGISRSENGEIKQVTDEDNKPRNVVVVRGTYSYPGEDGKPVNVQYYADENGYHAEGETIPKVPARQ